jgi:hypothetical protein
MNVFEVSKSKHVKTYLCTESIEECRKRYAAKYKSNLITL